jgi:hypothetical protein
MSALPEALRRFCDPGAPLPARTMAARGLVPLKGGDLVTVLAQLAADPDPTISEAAIASLQKMPDNVLLVACDGPLDPSVLDALAERIDRREVRERISLNAATADGTIELLAKRADDALGERIATNEARLLRAPAIIGALYNNRNVRMSTADRLIELAARHGVEVPGLPKDTFDAHVEAIQGELLFEATEEPLPEDVDFADTIAADDDDPDAIEIDPVKSEEKIREKHLPLSMKIGSLSKAKKIRLAQIGSAAARALLVRDNDRQIAMTAVRSPQLSIGEATSIAHSRQVSEEVLKYVGNTRNLTRSAEVKRALVFNPKTPFGISLSFLAHMNANDLRDISRSRNVAPQLKSAAIQKIAAKERKDK